MTPTSTSNWISTSIFPKKLLANPLVVVVATALTSELKQLALDSDFTSGGTRLKGRGDTLICRIDVGAVALWADTSNKTIRDALHAAEKSGVGLGCSSSAFDQLKGVYRSAGVYERALIDCVAYWSWTGMISPLPESATRSIWTAYLPPLDAGRYDALTLDDQQAIFNEACDAATTLVLGTTSLLHRSRDGWFGTEAISNLPPDALSGEAAIPLTDYYLDNLHRVDSALWNEAARLCADDPRQAKAVADRATLAGNHSTAIELYSNLAQRGDIRAKHNLAALLTNRDPPDIAEARRLLTTVAEIDEAEAEHDPEVLFIRTASPTNLGNLHAFSVVPPELEEARHWWTAAAEAGQHRCPIQPWRPIPHPIASAQPHRSPPLVHDRRRSRPRRRPIQSGLPARERDASS